MAENSPVPAVVAPVVPPCLLTPIKKKTNQFTSTKGNLSLVVVQGTGGTTDLDTVNSKVSDISVPANPSAVSHTATTSNLSFAVLPGKTYLIQLAFVQLPNPYSTTATLKEACGQIIDTIDVTNLFPTYLVMS